MRTIALLSQKGGTGKTTATLGLAVQAARCGLAVGVVDLDPQANATGWRDRREAADVAVISCVPARLRIVLDGMRRGGVQLALIDTPGRLEAMLVEAARAADLVLIPMRLGIFDAETLPAVRNVLGLAGGTPALLVLNGLHTSATRLADESKRRVAAGAGIPVSPVHLCQRAEYGSAPDFGLMPQETDPDGGAARELAALYDVVMRTVPQ